MNAPMTPTLDWDNQAAVIRAGRQKITHSGLLAFGRLSFTHADVAHAALRPRPTALVDILVCGVAQVLIVARAYRLLAAG